MRVSWGFRVPAGEEGGCLLYRWLRYRTEAVRDSLACVFSIFLQSSFALRLRFVLQHIKVFHRMLHESGDPCDVVGILEEATALSRTCTSRNTAAMDEAGLLAPCAKQSTAYLPAQRRCVIRSVRLAVIKIARARATAPESQAIERSKRWDVDSSRPSTPKQSVSNAPAEEKYIVAYGWQFYTLLVLCCFGGDDCLRVINNPI